MRCNFTGLNPRYRVLSLFALIALMTLSYLPVLAHQDQRITLNVSNKTLKNVFHSIEEQAEIVIMYDMNAIDDNEKVSLNVKDLYLEDVLSKLLVSKSLKWSKKGNVVRIYKEAAVKSLGDPVDLLVSVSGKVTDSDGQPLPGATIMVKGTKMGTSTDIDGKFVLADVPANGRLMITYTSYEPKEVSVKGQNFFLVGLKKVVGMLDETVVIAYGTTTRRLNTGNVSTVKGEDIEKQPVSNPLAALEGRVPGLVITQTTGAPGGEFIVQIRGRNSIKNGNDPLYIIDGIPYTSQLLPNINTLGKGGNPLNFINPYDIESIDVLKDADATSIYGSRGANGVILITTKKGKIGALKVNFNFYSGIGKVTKFMDLLDTKEYLEMRREAFKNDDVIPTINNAPDLLFWDTSRTTNWQKILIGGTANYTDAQVSLTGGNETTQFIVGGGYHKETTVFPGDAADQKASMHLNINSTSPNGKFKVQISNNFVYNFSNLISSDFIGEAASLAPNAPELYNSDGSLNWEPIHSGESGTWVNPMAKLLLKYKGLNSNLVSNGILSYTLVPHLEIKTTFGYTNLQTDEKSIQPSTFYDPGANVQSGSALFNTAVIRSWIIEPQLNYRFYISKGLLTVLVGSTFQQNRSVGQQFTATGFSSDALLTNLQAASDITVGTYTSIKYKYNAIFGRLNYNWQDKYLVNFTARRDGTSRFGPDKQFANFSGIGIAWIFSNENFIKNNSSLLSFGKLRASYGTTGSDQVGDYRFLDLFTNTQQSYQGLQGLYPQNLFNPDLAWEINKKLEGGIELGFLKDKVTISANYYRNRSSNQLLGYPLSDVTGFQSINANLPATVQNSGLEIFVNTLNLKSRNFSWNSSVNITVPRNKLISYPNLATSSFQGQYAIGQPITTTKLYKFGGVDSQTGSYQFISKKGDFVSTPEEIDKIILSDNTAKYYGGIQNQFKYKGFEVDFFVQFVKQKGTPLLWQVLPGYKGYNQPKYVLERWRQPGDVSNIQKFTQADFSIYNLYTVAAGSSLLYQDASFIRFKNLSLSYQLPNLIKQKMHVQNFRLYIQCQNLFTITNYKGYDPENQGGNSALPVLKVFTAGTQITF